MTYSRFWPDKLVANQSLHLTRGAGTPLSGELVISRGTGTGIVRDPSHQFPKIRAISSTIIETSFTTGSIIRKALHEDNAGSGFRTSAHCLNSSHDRRTFNANQSLTYSLLPCGIPLRATRVFMWVG